MDFLWGIELTEPLRPLNAMDAGEVLAEEGGFTNFVRALELSGVGDLLDRKGPYTVFAPGDEMFNIHSLGITMGSAMLEDVLRHFIVPGKYPLEALRRQPTLKAIGGYPVIITVKTDVLVNGARIVKPDVPFRNGIIHEITSRGKTESP